MPEYTTITVSKELKEELNSEISEEETWNEYLQRLKSEKPEQETVDNRDGLSENDLNQIREMFREVSGNLDREETGSSQAEDAEIDYNHLREIVREEVRRALEEIVR